MAIETLGLLIAKVLIEQLIQAMVMNTRRGTLSKANVRDNLMDEALVKLRMLKMLLVSYLPQQ